MRMHLRILISALIALIIDGNHRDVSSLDLLQRFLCDLHLSCIFLTGYIYDLNQKGSILHLLQCGMEGFHQIMREIGNKADGVGQQKGFSIRQIDMADTGVQSGKQHILFQHLFILLIGTAVLQQHIHDGTFSGICIADQRYERQHGFLSCPPLIEALCLYFLQLSLQLLNPCIDSSSIQLQLLFSGTLVFSAAALSSQLCIGTDQTGKQLLQLCALNLQSCGTCDCPAFKNGENELCTVHDRRL